MIKLTEKQTAAYDLALSGQKNFILYGGAMGGGKTYWLLSVLIALCSIYPKSRWLFIRKDLQTLKKNTLPTFHRFLDMGLKHFIDNFNADTFTYTFKNGSQIMFMGENYDKDKELNRFRGLEINGAAFDELNEIQEDTLNIAFARSGRWEDEKGAPILIIASCNPTQNWVKERIYNPWTNNTLPDNWAYITAKITDNPYLSPEYIHNLKTNLPPLEYAMYVEGNWDVVKVINPFAYNYSMTKHEDRTVQRDNSKQIICGIDFNLNPFGAIFGNLWRDQDGEHLHIFDEVSIENGSIDAMCDYIKSTYWNKLSSIMITGDYMGTRGDISQRDNAHLYEQIRRKLKLSKAQIKLKPNPTHENSRSDVNYVLANFPDLKINPETCPSLCMDMKVVQCDIFGEIIKRNRKDVSQRADHLDCFTGDTIIMTKELDKQIKDIEIGEYVTTRKGHKRVIDKWNSIRPVYKYTLNDGTILKCTRDHKLYTHEHGYVAIHNIFERKLTLWKNSSYTRESDTQNIQNKNIITVLTKEEKNNIQDLYTDKFGMITMEKYPMVIKFITKMAMPLITVYKIMNWLRNQHIQDITQKKDIKKILNYLLNFKKKELKKPKNGMPLKKEKFGIHNTQKKYGKTKKREEKSVNIVHQNLIISAFIPQNTVQINANLPIEDHQELITRKENVYPVKLNLKRTDIHIENIVHQHVKIERCEYIGLEMVYDITVEHEHEFYANGILSHNCLRYLSNTFLRKWIDHQLKSA